MNGQRNESLFFEFKALRNLYNKFPKYYRRLLQIYTFLLIIIFSVVTYSVYYFYESKDEYGVFLEKTTSYEKFKNEVEVIEDTMDVIVKLIAQYDITREYSAENTESYSKLNFERIYNIMVLLQKLQTDFSGYNLNVFLTRLTDGMVISGKGNTYSLENSQENGDIDVISAATLLDEQHGDISSSIIPGEKVSDKINFVYKINYENQAPIYIFIAFSYENMKYVYDKNTKSHYILSGYSKKTLDVVKKRVANAVISEPIKYVELDEVNSLFYGTSDSDKNVIFAQTFTKTKPNLALAIIFWAIVIIFISVILASILARYSYIPIQRIMYRIGIDSGKNIDEVDVAERRINSILSSNSDMERALEDKNKIISIHFLFDLLNGFIWGDNIEKTATEFSLQFLCGQCILAVFQFDDELQDFDLDENEAFLRIKEKLLDRGNCICNKMQDKRAVVICEYDSDIISEIIDLTDKVGLEYNIRIIVAYSKTNGKTGEIAKIYRKLLNGLDNRALINRKTIITDEDIEQFSKDRLIYSTQSESALIKYCENGEKEKAVYCLKLILDANSSYTNDVFVSLKYALSITIKRILSNLDVSETELFGDKIHSTEEIIQAENFSGLTQIIRDLIELICDYVNENADMDNKDIGEEILEYIDENLKEDISISDISRKFGISSSYIGRILRTNYQTSFKIYIDKARVKKAKQMMDEDKNILIKDMAQSLGYNNAVSFIRMFKKSEGISPGMYLKLK